MINREQALKFLAEKVDNKNIVKHMIATEALMGAIWEELNKKGQIDPALSGTRQEWEMAGLLHDGDYNPAVPVEKQGIRVTEDLRAAGYEIPDSVAHAMAAHNADNTGIQPATLMDWTIFIGDSLTGLIVACALVRPDKKLASVELESVMKKFGQPSFAAGTRREQIKLCEEKLGIPLEEFVGISLKAMQAKAEELGL